jgi:hypothetical protein
MNLDLLDKTYPMVKFKLYFVDVDHTVPVDPHVRPVIPDLPILGANICPPVF